MPGFEVKPDVGSYHQCKHCVESTRTKVARIFLTYTNVESKAAMTCKTEKHRNRSGRRIVHKYFQHVSVVVDVKYGRSKLQTVQCTDGISSEAKRKSIRREINQEAWVSQVALQMDHGAAVSSRRC